jgi:hypothetical protein
MSKVLLIVMLAFAAIAVDADRPAQGAAWCLVGGDKRECGFYTFEACLASRSGGSSHCVQNPNFSGNQPSASRPPRSERRR